MRTQDKWKVSHVLTGNVSEGGKGTFLPPLIQNDSLNNRFSKQVTFFPFPWSLLSVSMTQVEEWRPWLTQDHKAAFNPEPVSGKCHLGEVCYGPCGTAHCSSLCLALDGIVSNSQKFPQSKTSTSENHPP